jgi:valyl-tRNA synthetase
VRDARARAGVKPKEKITVAVNSENPAFYTYHQYLLQRAAGIETMSLVPSPPVGWQTLVVGTDKLYLEPLAGSAAGENLGGTEAMQKELAHLRGFLVSVDKKLLNEKFMQNAQPQVIAAEQKKKADTLAKITALEESLGTA